MVLGNLEINFESNSWERNHQSEKLILMKINPRNLSEIL